MKIIVTGGANGLGKAIVEKLAKKTANVILFTYNSSIQSAQELISNHSNLIGCKCDFLNPEEMVRLKTEIVNFNPDVIINSAFMGKITKDYFHKLNVLEFKNGFLNNLIPVIELNQLVIQLFRKKKDGRIITILSSVLVGEPIMGWSEYTAAKAYLHSLCKSWAVENAKFNITSNCISPSFMTTDLTSDTDERIVEEMVNNHPLKQLLTKEEVADSVEYLIGASKQINGINLILNAANKIA